MTGELFGALNKANSNLEQSPITPVQLGELIDLISDGSISQRIAKQIFAIMYESGDNPVKIVKDRGMEQVTDTVIIEAEIDRVIAANPDKVEQVKQKPKMLGWFVGQVMKTTDGKANPQTVNDIFKSKLNLE